MLRLTRYRFPPKLSTCPLSFLLLALPVEFSYITFESYNFVIIIPHRNSLCTYTGVRRERKVKGKREGRQAAKAKERVLHVGMTQNSGG